MYSFVRLIRKAIVNSWKRILIRISMCVGAEPGAGVTVEPKKGKVGS